MSICYLCFFFLLPVWSTGRFIMNAKLIQFYGEREFEEKIKGRILLTLVGYYRAEVRFAAALCNRKQAKLFFFFSFHQAITRAMLVMSFWGPCGSGSERCSSLLF